MPAKFTDGDLQVVLGLQSPWQQVFADRHGRERNPHGQMKLLCSNLLGLTLVEQHLQREEKQGRQRAIELVVAGASPGTHMLVLLQHLQPWIAKRNVRMTLYDPQPLDEALPEPPPCRAATRPLNEPSMPRALVRRPGPACSPTPRIRTAAE